MKDTVRVVKDIRCAGTQKWGGLCNKLLTRLVFEVPKDAVETILHAKVYTETKCPRCRNMHCSLSIV